ncbi:Hypothetical predicted protein [Octopus vulgaris]|uniref:Profilin n=1 Tax=Octopus vulgaris TaxID=6645 RepID=A0AA36FFC4_OCTVU|nr:Hypothetical predicted protein [Octopus vulgaris]
MSWEAWAPHLKQTQAGYEAASECGIYSLQGDPWYSSNEQLSAKTIKDLREMFSSTCDMSSVEFRETKYFKICVDENIARFKHVTKGGLVVGLGNECIIIAECDKPVIKQKRTSFKCMAFSPHIHSFMI